MNYQTLDSLRQVVNIAYFGQRKCGFRCDAQQIDLFMRSGNRTILNCSRQTGKSTAAALKAVHSAWIRPQSTVIVTAPTRQQTREFIRKVRNFAFLSGATLRGGKLIVELKNGSRIVGIAANEDTVRGFSSVSLLIIDEASRVNDEVYYALLPMLAVSNGAIWLLSTPKGKRGFFHAEWDSSPEKARTAPDGPSNARTGPDGPSTSLELDNPATSGSVVRASSSRAQELDSQPSWYGSLVRENSLKAKAQQQLDNPASSGGSAGTSNEGWVKIRTQGQDCPRISADFLESQKRRMGERRFAQEFECVFIDIAHGVFHPDAVRAAFTDKIKPLDF